MKRFAIISLVFCFACTLFSMQIVGCLAKLVIKFKYDCELAYRSCKWEEGGFVFSDLVIFDSSFHAHIEKASIQFDWSSLPRKLKGHIAMDDLSLSLLKQRQLPVFEPGWFDCSVSIQHGVFEWGGRVQFSLDYDADLTQLVLDWENADALITLQDEKWEISCNHFNLPLLNPWIPYQGLSDGFVTGRFAINTEKELLSANLQMTQVGFDLGANALQDVSGSLSYNAGLGAKWEVRGLGKDKEVFFPFSCAGRGFFQNHWLESEIQFEESLCKISHDGNWNLICDSIGAKEASLFQSIFALVYPDISCWTIESGTLSATATLQAPNWSAQFQASQLSVKKGEYLLTCESASGQISQEGGRVTLLDPEYELQFIGNWDDWDAALKIQGATFICKGGWDGQMFPITIESGKFSNLEFSGKGWINTHLNGCFSIDGKIQFCEKTIPFYCPILSKQDNLYAFDLRFARQTWDFFRLAGTYDGKSVAYLPTSHFLGERLAFQTCEKNEIDFSLELPQKALKGASTILKEWGLDLRQLPAWEKTALHFQYKDGVNLQAVGDFFTFHAEEKKGEWQFDLNSALTLSAHLKPGGAIKGYAGWKEAIKTHFEGKIDPALHFACSLSDLQLDLKCLDQLPLEGVVRGGGHFIYNGEIDADFDLDSSSLSLFSYPLENEGQIHLSYSTKKGTLVRGLHLHGAMECVIDLLQYDQAYLKLQNAQMHIPAKFLEHKHFSLLDQDKDVYLTADLEIASDFSTFICKMQEGFIPYRGSYHRIENLNCSWQNGKCKADLNYLDQFFRIGLQIGDKISGQIAIGEEAMPLCIDWEYGDDLFIHSIVGAFSGIDASFHAESPNQLVGSAHVNFAILKNILPQEVAEGFEKIEMGQGYEFKGRLNIENRRPIFKGILSGKAIEFFGFQFRTLLAQVDLAPDKMRIFDVKMSDSSGMMKIDEILLEDHDPWTIQIPHIGLYELRPSLMQRPGGSVGPISPLVVRELKIDNFKGILSDGSTYTATGHLHFINSYKREETVFDVPANVLSRIVGLDLELLIPATGDLTFDIKDGYFNLLELTNAYSEGKRSQFFLETNPAPRMDLDGNLQIFIKMKQFVLLKITESFLISIDGVLDDPQFSLKRRRFFGLI